MEVYRIAKKSYLSDLSGTGARLYGGRWNKIGLPLLYTSSHLSLAVLELLANHVRQLIDDSYGYIKLEIPDVNLKKLPLASLHSNWRISPYHESTIEIGSTWIQSHESLGLEVPSAVLTQEQNILINPLHKEFRVLTILDIGELSLDGRVV